MICRYVFLTQRDVSNYFIIIYTHLSCMYIFSRCLCSHCQIMNTVEESICCQEILEILWKNEEVAQVEQFQIPNCITDNPGFQAVC